MKAQTQTTLRERLVVHEDLIEPILNKEEVWLPIAVPGFEQYYDVSSRGRIKRHKRTYTVTYKNGSVHNRVAQETIKDYKNSINKYISISLSNGTSKIKYTVHQLMALTFFGVRSTYTTVVDHIDNNPHNNAIENLQIVTNRYNVTKGNLSKTTSSEYTGVYWHSGIKKWCAMITIKGIRKHLLSSTSEIECAIAYATALSNVQSS